MGSEGFFSLENGETINSAVYRDQILLGPLQQFWKEAFESIDTSVVMEDNAPVYKKVYIPVRVNLGMQILNQPANSPDLNPIENIWSYMKDIITKDYATISSAEEMKRIVKRIWDNFEDREWDKLIESLPNRMAAVIAVKGGSTRY